MKMSDQLASWLALVNVKALARESGISAKTIYRLRHKKNAARLDTVQKLQDAAGRLERRAAKAAA